MEAPAAPAPLAPPYIVNPVARRTFAAAAGQLPAALPQPILCRPIYCYILPDGQNQFLGNLRIGVFITRHLCCAVIDLNSGIEDHLIAAQAETLSATMGLLHQPVDPAAVLRPG
jgi:hypothetical protein